LSIGRTAIGIGIAFLVSLSACADGGVGGTGISTVQGNVLQVEMNEPGLLAGVTVREPVTGLEDTTDEDGQFVLVGRFPVEATLLFFPPGVEEPARMDVTVTQGSEVTLKNVHIREQTATPESIVVSLGGVVSADADCEEAGGSFGLEVDGLAFIVVLDAETEFVNRPCTELVTGARIRLKGLQQGLVITAEQIRIVEGVDDPLP